MISEDELNRNFEKDQEKFGKCGTNLERINFFLYHDMKTSVTFTTQNLKDDERSAEFRQLGNDNFVQQKYIKAVEYYTKSIACAATPAVAALAYANRAKVLTKRRLYEQSLTDYKRALESDYPSDKREELVEKQEKIAKKIDTRRKHGPSEIKTHSSDSILSKNDNKYGRHVIATKDLEIGDLLLTEQPFAAVLVQDFFIYCHECISLCYNPIPCENCAEVVYCSVDCKREAFETYHKYECPILASLLEMFPNVITELKLALKMTFLAKKWPKKYKEVKNLLTHIEQRPLKYMYEMSWNSFLVYTLLKEKTTLLEDFPNFSKSFKQLFFRNLLIFDINGVGISRLELHLGGHNTVRVAAGLYFQYSSFNHSCHPNCFFYHDGSTLVVRVLETIKKGEQCFISYRCTYGIVPKIKRQIELKKKYFFICTCKACEEDWSEEEPTQEFDEPFCAVQLALLENSTDLIQDLLPIFVKRLKCTEKSSPNSAVTCLRQLVVDCYQVYESPYEL